MPIYEYECPSCSHKFELRRSFSDESEVCCPECKTTADRIFSPVPIIFKGSGFYVTDHKKSNHGHSSTAPTSESEKAPVSAESPSDTGTTKSTSSGKSTEE